MNMVSPPCGQACSGTCATGAPWPAPCSCTPHTFTSCAFLLLSLSFSSYLLFCFSLSIWLSCELVSWVLAICSACGNCCLSYQISQTQEQSSDLAVLTFQRAISYHGSETTQLLEVTASSVTGEQLNEGFCCPECCSVRPGGEISFLGWRDCFVVSKWCAGPVKAIAHLFFTFFYSICWYSLRFTFQKTNLGKAYTEYLYQ